MRGKENGPGAASDRDPTLETYSQPRAYPTVRTERTLTDLGQVFAVRILHAEQTLLSAGWRDPAELNEAACDAGLTGGDFVDARHSLQFWYLCRCAELDRAPSIQEALTVATTCADVFLDLDDLDAVLWHIDALPSSRLPMLAETVVENSRNRERAQSCLREGVAILVGQLAFDFDVVIRPCESRAGGRVR